MKPYSLDSRTKALALHRSGNVSEALRMYEALLEDEPSNPDILGLAGMAQYQLGNSQTAKTKWIESLSEQSEPPVMLRNMNNLLTALLKEKNADELQFVIDLPIPDWPMEPVPTVGEKNMIISLARGLLQIGRKPAALKLLASVAPCLADNPRFAMDVAEVMLEAGHAEHASSVLQPLTAVDQENDGALLILHAAAALAAGQREDAFRLTAKAVEALPVHLTAKASSQALLIGVLNEAPKLIAKQMSPQLLHFLKNSPASLAWKLNNDYRFLSIFPEAATARRELEKLPKPDVILNNWVNAETLSTPGTLAFISGFADSLDLRVLNHPRKAAETTRQRNAERLSGIPDLVVPRIIRFFNESGKPRNLVRAVGNSIGFPLIVRNPFTQMGKQAARLDTPGQLEKYLVQVPGRQLYAIEFVNNLSAGGIYRKIRVAVIGDEIFVAHVHCDRDWNVHSRKGKKPALDLPRATLRFAEDLTSDPLKTIGKPGMSALREIRNRIPLDFFGIDFDIMPDGRILFFEANAAMKISMSNRAGQEEIRAGMRAALRRLFEGAALRGS